MSVQPAQANGGGPGSDTPPRRSREEPRRSREEAGARSSTRTSGATTNTSTSGVSKTSPSTSEEKRESEQQQPGRKDHVRKPVPLYITVSRLIVEDRFFIAFTTVLTVYALVGDDLRLWLTNADADQYFDMIVVICIVIFSFEVVASCFGKVDYYFSFFFFLDLVSTVTLVLDLSIVSDEMATGGEDDIEGGGSDASDAGSDKLKSGRTARIGAKAGRVVRVLRLVRIIKLYKAFYEAQARKKAREEAKARGDYNQDDDWDDEEMDDDAESPEKYSRESRVGKKLSEVTTRRVIFLILSSLLVPPLIAQQPADYFESPDYGAVAATLAFEEYASDPNEYNREHYETEMLRMILYHNWYTSTGCYGDTRCPQYYYGHLFWFGIRGSDEARVKDFARLGQVRPSAVTKFVQKSREWYRTEDRANEFVFNYGHIPKVLEDQISRPWTDDCTETGPTGVTHKLGISLLKEEIEGYVSFPIKCAKGVLRKREYMSYWNSVQTLESSTRAGMYFLIDMRPFVEEDAAYNILTTCFVCVCLLAASLTFSHDANRLVLNPLENMIRRVEAIRDNPLIAMKMADEEFKAEEVAKARMKKAAAKERFRKALTDILTGKVCKSEQQEPMETMILEKTIIKLGSLLALGFGEAGANIIGANMSNADSTGVNAMITGVRVDCIIGMARVRNFSTATEVLQSKIMKFVNQIAEIVHGVVNEAHGAANKNYGDMFLIIWQIRGVEKSLRGRIAEMSIAAFARVLSGVHRSPILAGYRTHPGLQLRLGSHCRVHMSFGLHKGWAIEGAVGSEFKIDASYLSPNVSIARSVESATSIYGVPLVIAESVVELCCYKLKTKCRLIDRVVITGSPAPMLIYSLDLDFNSLKVDDSPPLKLVWSTRQRFRARQFLEVEKTGKLAEDFDIVGQMESDKDFKTMRLRYNTEFLELFKMGYQNYAEGEWQVARRMLSQTRHLLGTGFEDGPSAALLKFMEVPYKYEAPPTWAGVRDLTTAGNQQDKSPMASAKIAKVPTLKSTSRVKMI